MRPVPGRVTVPYWERGSAWAGGHHRGIDFAAPVGTPVVAPWSGMVTSAQWGPAYGRHLVIDFDRLPDGSPGLWGVLAHLSEKSVKPGDRVKAGQVVGRSGATGNVTGPHLHFEVQTGPMWRPRATPDVSRNPQPWIDAQKEAPPVGFPVGSTVLVDRTAAAGDPLTIVPEQWTTVGRIDIPGKTAHYFNTIQVRLPGGTWAEFRLVRVGWGKDPDGRDETGYHPFYPHPDGGAYSDSFTHGIHGGGPIEFQLLLHGPKAPTVVPTIICKAYRDH